MKKKLLLIEDNSDDILLMERALQKAGVKCELIIQRDGVAGLHFLYGNGSSVPGLPDLILLDLNMPKISGFEFLKQVRSVEDTRYIPVVILTSSGEDQDIINSYAAGANSFIKKPIDFMQFIDTIRSVVRYWFEFNQAPPLRRI